MRELGPPPRYWQTHHWPLSARPQRAFIVHGKCADGFTSAGLLLNRWPDGMVVYAQPGELLQRLEHALENPPRLELVLADLAPQTHETQQLLDVLAQLRRHCRITWIDHHAPQWSATFEQALRDLRVEVILDRTETESGASLVARWAKITDARLLHVADMVRRRDAWVDPHNPQARAWTSVAGVRRREYVESLADLSLDGLEAEGLRMVNERDARVERLVKSKVRSHGRHVRWQWRVDDVSDVADRLFQMDPHAVVFLRFGRSGNVSVRTRHDRPIAAEIAQSFGGGGHAHAAGFRLRLPWPQRILYRLLRARDASGRTVRRRAEEHARRASPPGATVTRRPAGPLPQ